MSVLTDKTELSESPANNDLVHIVDVSDTTGSAAGTSKKIQAENLSPVKLSGSEIVPHTDGNDFNIGTGKYKGGSNTEISESSGNTLIENTSATNTMDLKLGEAAGVTKVRILASDDTVVATIDSVGSGTFTINLDSVLDLTNSSGVTQEKLNTIGDNYSKGLYIPVGKSASLADDAQVQVSTGKAGFGLVNIGNNQEYAYFSFSTSAVTLVSNSANVDNADTDTKLCIYYSGGILYLKNRLGSALDLRYIIWNS